MSNQVPLSDALSFRKPRGWKGGGRHRVYAGIVPDDFQPESPVELPDRLTSAEALDYPVTMSQGIALTRHFNREQLAAGLVDRRWALLVFRPRKGGAA